MLAKETSSKTLEQDTLDTASVLSHIVHLDEDVGPPQYVEQQPIMDMTPLLSGSSVDRVSINLLEDWPEQDVTSPLDDSQLAALNRILSKRLAIVQVSTV